MHAVLHLLWDLSQPGAACTVDDLERGVHEAGIARFDGLEGMLGKVWFRDGERYGSVMVFESSEARDAILGWVTERVSGLCGLAPSRVESYDVIATVPGAVGWPTDDTATSREGT